MSIARKKRFLLSTILILNAGLSFNGFSMENGGDAEAPNTFTRERIGETLNTITDAGQKNEIPSLLSAGAPEGSADVEELSNQVSALSVSSSSSALPRACANAKVEINCFNIPEDLVQTLGKERPVDINLTYNDPDNEDEIGNSDVLNNALQIIINSGISGAITKLSVTGLSLDNNSINSIGQNITALTSLSLVDSTLDECDDYNSFAALTALTEINLSYVTFDQHEKDHGHMFKKNIGFGFSKLLNLLKKIQIEKITVENSTILPNQRLANSVNTEYNAWAGRIVKQCASTLSSLSSLQTLNMSDVLLGPIFIGSFEPSERESINFSNNSFKIKEIVNFIKKYKDKNFTINLSGNGFSKEEFLSKMKGAYQPTVYIYNKESSEEEEGEDEECDSDD